MYGKTQTKNLLKELEKKKLDCLLLVNLDLPQIDPNFYYFTGADQFEHSTLILGKSSKMYVPEFEVDRAGKDTWIKNIDKIPRKNFIKSISKELKGKKVGINGKFLPLNFYNKLKKEKVRMIDFSKTLVEMRLIKSEEEITLLSKAVRATKSILAGLDKSKAENELAADIQYELWKRSMKSAFDPIVAYDADSTIPHFEVGTKKGGKCLLVDMGAKWKNYHADLTRTFILDKKEKELKKIYNVVKEASLASIDSVKPGVMAKTVFKAGKDYMERQGYKLVHSIGHGIGLEIHEQPWISANSKMVLKPGMVFTVEPGIYLKGKYGVRIEDDVLVTKTGCKILSK